MVISLEKTKQTYVETTLHKFMSRDSADLGLLAVQLAPLSSHIAGQPAKYDVRERYHQLILVTKLLFRPFILKTPSKLAELSLGEVGVEPGHRKVRECMRWTSA